MDAGTPEIRALTDLKALPGLAVAQAVEFVVVDVVAVAKGYRTSRLTLTGRQVFNERNEEIGRIDDFIIGRDKVLFAVRQVGGFLGVGSNLVAVPYRSLDLQGTQGKVLLEEATQLGAQEAAAIRVPETVSVAAPSGARISSLAIAEVCDDNCH